MMNSTEIDKAALAVLRVPFPPEQIGKLPKGGIWLDFVGHGFLTQRLLDADPTWNWEPLAFDERGLPALDENGGLWIRLTVGGVTRLGYGDAGGRHGSNAIKEAIGDALRNAAMRFGAALDLWCKGDPDAAPAPALPNPATEARVAFAKWCDENGKNRTDMATRFNGEYGKHITKATADEVEAFQQMLAEEVALDDAADAELPLGDDE